MQKRFILDCDKEAIVYKKNTLCQAPILSDCSGHHPQSCTHKIYVSKICFNYFNWLVFLYLSKFPIFYLQPPLSIFSNTVSPVLHFHQNATPHPYHMCYNGKLIICILYNIFLKKKIPPASTLHCSCHLKLQHLPCS